MEVSSDEDSLVTLEPCNWTEQDKGKPRLDVISKTGIKLIVCGSTDYFDIYWATKDSQLKLI